MKVSLFSKKRLILSCLVLCVFVTFASCQKAESKELELQGQKVLAIYTAHKIPTPQFTEESLSIFLKELESLIENDSEGLLILADKQHFLSDTYEPNDLIELKSNELFSVNKAGMTLRKPAYDALIRMTEAAKQDGLKHLVSSAYRSFSYQERVYNWNVVTYGQEAADRESARPGTSQHQLGTVIDFGSITNEFAQTAEGKWIFEHAEDFGFSLSYPEGYEPITGYMWESWHYRYIGTNAVAFQKKWFGNIQQYMLEFIHEWKERSAQYSY